MFTETLLFLPKSQLLSLDSPDLWFTMFRIWSLVLFLRLSLVPSTQAASPPVPLQNIPITLTETTNVTVASDASSSLTNPSNELTLTFTKSGRQIPADELRHTLSVAAARVEGYLPQHADEPIAHSLFETSVTFPETGDGISVFIHAFGFGLSWRQLSDTLMTLQLYMLGMEPNRPAHLEELEFYVQRPPVAGVPDFEVAFGEVEFTPGARAVAKRNPITTALQLPHANSSSLSTVTVPFIFNIAVNLDLNITALGLPIPKDALLDTIEAAFTDVILGHTDFDAAIPLRPSSFNTTSGKRPHEFTTEIELGPYPGEKISWGLLCIIIYGLRDFVRETGHYNSLAFEVEHRREGVIGHGDVNYWPSGKGPEAVELTAQ